MTQDNEKRQHPRYPVPDESAVLVYPSVTLSDDLIDVSMGGVAFSYREPEPLEPGQRLLINIIRGGISIEDLPAIVTSDHEFAESREGDPVRRCGVQFKELSAEQKEKLSTLIEELNAL